MISSIRSLNYFKDLLICENKILRFNQTILLNNSPINSVYTSQIRNNSLFLAAGEEDQIYPYNYSERLNSTLFTSYGILAYYNLFPDTGHALETYQLDSALVNFFNLKLRDITPPNGDILTNPYISELDTILTFKEIPRSYSEDENVFLGLSNIFTAIPIGFLIPYIISVSLFYFFIYLLYNLKEDPTFLSLKKRKKSKKEYREVHRTKKVIVRRIEKRRIVAVTDDRLKKEIDRTHFLYNKRLGALILIFTLLNFILIPTLGMTYLNLNLYLLWVSILIFNMILSVVFFSKYEEWEWKETQNKLRSKNPTVPKRFQKFIDILENNPFYQILFYISILFLVVLSIAFFISPLQLNIGGFGLDQIFSTLILSAVLILMTALILIWFDRKYINPSNHMIDYGLDKRQILKGFSFGVLISQVPLVILIIASFILVIPQPFLSESYSFVYIGIPFIFLYFFGFELIFRVLIQNKIKGNKKGEFLIGSLFYAQFIGIFSYLIFMNSYTSTLVFSGLPISYSGLFGLVFVFFSIIGTLNYMITRTPVASSISNTLILFFLLAVLI